MVGRAAMASMAISFSPYVCVLRRKKIRIRREKGKEKMDRVRVYPFHLYLLGKSMDGHID